jgi:GNAT superfamily N-acetyltransferase
MATVMAEVAERGRFELPRDESLAVFKKYGPVCGPWMLSVEQPAVDPRVKATVMAADSGAMTAAYAEHLARRDYEAVGFIPRPRLDWYAERGQILVEQENGDPCGVLVFGNGWPTLRIYQAVVQYDARRREHGLRLVSQAIEEARKRGCHAIGLWCADDLDSNDFWQSAGFSFAGQRIGGRTRGRRHNRWVLPIDGPQLRLDLGAA